MGVPIFVEFVAGLGGFMTGLGAAEVQMKSLAASGEGGMANIAKAAPIMGAAVLGAAAVVGGEAVKMAADFESSQQRLVSTAGERSSDLKMVSDGILDMAGKVGFSAQELSTGMYTVESAGYHGADGLAVMKAAAQGAAAEGADLSTVTNGVTTTLHDYGWGADRAGEVTSKMVAAVGEGKTTFQDFAGALEAVQPTAAAVGIKVDDLYGSLAAMTSSGKSAQESAQNLNHAISNLSKPTAQMTDEMAQIGLSSVDLQTHLGEKGIAGTMQEISKAITDRMGPAGTMLVETMNQSKTAAADLSDMYGKMSDPQKHVIDGLKNGSIAASDLKHNTHGLSLEQANQVMQWAALDKRATGFSSLIKAGGSDVQNYTGALSRATGGMDGMAVALQLAGENGATTADKIGTVGAATTDANGNVKGFADTQETLTQKMKDLHAEVGALMIKLGDELLPVVKSVAEHLMGFIEFLKTHQGVAQTLGFVLGTILVAALVAVTAATVSWTIALLANPAVWIVLLIIAVVGLLVFGIYELVTHWSAVWQTICDIAKAVGSYLKGCWDDMLATVKRYWNDITGFFSDRWNAMYSSASNGVRAVRDYIASCWQDVIDTLHRYWNDITGFFSDRWNAMTTSASNGAHAILDAITGAWQDVIDTTRRIWNDVLTWIHDRWEDIKHNVSDAVHNVLDTLTNIGNDIYNATIQPLVDAAAWFVGFVEKCVNFGHDMVMGMVRGVKNAGGELLNAVKGVASDALHGVAGFLGIASPSRVFAETIGAPITQGIAVGITGQSHLVDAALAGVTAPGNVAGPAVGGSALGSLAGNGAAQQQGGTVVQITVQGNYYGTGGADQLADDVHDALLRKQNRGPLGFRAA